MCIRDRLPRPVLHAYGNLFAADRAFSAEPVRLLRQKTLMAIAVAVQMIFSLFREKFDRPKESFAGPYGASHAAVGQRCIETIGLPPQPVSYTHLDVYKRQMLCRCCSSIF